MLHWYLMCSYLYYKCGTSPVPDRLYDFWCAMLLAFWDDFEHPHKYLVSVSDLEAGTGYALRYPLLVEHAALYLRERAIELPDMEAL